MTMPDPGSVEEAKLIRWTRSLGPFAEAVVGNALHRRRQYLQAVDKFPAYKAYHESLRRAYDLAAQAAEIALQWEPEVRRTNLKDFLRNVDAPRNGSLAVESRADNLAAQKDRDTW